MKLCPQEMLVKCFLSSSKMFGLLRNLCDKSSSHLRYFLQVKKCLGSQEIFVRHFLSSSKMFGWLRNLCQNVCLIQDIFWQLRNV